MKNLILVIFLFFISCSPREFIIKQLTPKKTELENFFLEPEEPYEATQNSSVDQSWSHPRYKTTLSYRSYCYPFLPSFEIAEDIMVLALKNAGIIDKSLNFEDFVEDSQVLDIDYENKSWLLTYEDPTTKATGVADVTLLKAGNCLYSIHFISEQTLYRVEKHVLENFINNFKP